ncbi:sulfotransferase [Haliea sp. E1-2-M8]|uniref:tetratricopeptide repeat-containing sulfotransferase family protein n=1 Tax=Haliea sp. E1-2-M8 TaxID=3064706 RepID=UPI002717E68E|nr:sulfotransferase family protein [Haliea sp. E1-2-M8]MDO8860218.1 sulfotransferase [Haliea sp. E1-2-M8]
MQQAPAEPQYRDRLATLLEHSGQREQALACYERFLRDYPGETVSRYNYACVLRRAGRNEEALAQFGRALEEKISDPQEVLATMAPILADLQRHAEARQALDRSLALDPAFYPALYNLALLEEEEGNQAQARMLLQRILARSPHDSAALARLANGQRLVDPADPLPGQLERALANVRNNPFAEEELRYALGKLRDDLAQYPEAFAQYTEGNRLSRQRVGPYDRAGQEQLVAALQNRFAERPPDAADTDAFSPVFVCGMFRSGSTLLEQMLAAHPAVTAGGELDFFPSRVPLNELPGPIPAESLALSDGYRQFLANTFPGAGMVTNKRPDNFLYLGLILSLFPSARVLYTHRNPLDNCLSVYFQQLGPGFRYANDLLDTGHFYRQQQRLLEHWQRVFPDNILLVEYEQLVTAPREQLAQVLAFLGLPWNDGCLDFARVRNRVRTASVTQVREGLYTRSCERWRNYARQLEPLAEYLRQQGFPNSQA